MRSVAEQFDAIARAYGGASLRATPDGAQLVMLPNVSLPAGWSQHQTHVRFVVPVGYPYAVPDCFWTDPTLRLAQGQLPKNTVIGQVTPSQPDRNLLWFSWHVTPNTWSPSTSNLMTYVQVIRRRLEQPQ